MANIQSPGERRPKFARATLQEQAALSFPGASEDNPMLSARGARTDKENARTDNPNGPAMAAAKPKVRRSFSWGKKRKKTDVKAAAAPAQKNMGEPEPMFTEVYAVQLSREQADAELGMVLHEGTGDVIVSYVGPTIEGISVGDAVLSIHSQQVHGTQFYDNGDVEIAVDNLEIARHLLREPGMESVEVTIEKHTLRTEILKRHAALRGTSLDKLGMTLVNDEAHPVVVSGLDGLALKSGRIVVGDRLVSVNGTPCRDLTHAAEMLTATDLQLEVELEFTYGFLAPKDHEFDAASGEFVPVVKEKPLGIVKRSLSFGKNRKKRAGAGGETPRAGGSGASSQAEAPAADAAASIPELDFEHRMLSIDKNDEGRICVTFKVHDVTGELMIGLVGEDSPASRAGVQVGDRVLAMGAKATGCEFFDQGGLEDLELARRVLEAAASERTIEMVVATRMRTEVLEFGHSPDGLGGPRNFLGLSFFSFPDDTAVRITAIRGPAARSGRFGLGDRIVAVNGVRVNHAGTLSKEIATLALTQDRVEFDVLLGYQHDEGVWYGKDGQGVTPRASADGETTARKAKRSFSFGRKPKH